MLGLKRDVNLLVDHDPLWASEFAEEKTRIAAVLGPLAKGIEHHGSTSVPGMRAKPILDMLVGVLPLENWQECKAPLESIGYDWVPAAGIPRHQIFACGRDETERTHILHIVEFDSRDWLINLAFRDALRSDPELRARYVAEKERAAKLAPQGRPRYNELKAPFIVDILNELELPKG